jgi:hypothetical protein
MNKFMEWLEMAGALVMVGIMAFFGFVALLLCTPWPWLVLIAYIIATNW